MTLVHTSFYKVTSISFLLSIASHIFVAGFYLLLEKKKCRPLPFGILVTLSCLLVNFSVIVFCTLLPAAFLDCRWGVRNFRGYFSLLGALATSTLQLRACKAPLPDLGVSSIPPSGPLLQLLYRRTGEHSESRPCNTEWQNKRTSHELLHLAQCALQVRDG